MNVFDEMANGTYQPPKLTQEIRYMLAKQIPNIPHYELVLETKYGQVIINDPILVVKIKQLIEQYYSNQV